MLADIKHLEELGEQVEKEQDTAAVGTHETGAERDAAADAQDSTVATDGDGGSATVR